MILNPKEYLEFDLPPLSKSEGGDYFSHCSMQIQLWYCSNSKSIVGSSL
jgi:hypothetical protein